MQCLKIALLALLMPVLGVGSAHAEGRFWPAAGGLLREGIRACGGDIARYCGRTVPGQGRMMQCLADSYDELSASCQRFVDRSFDVRNALLACTADAERLCPGVPPGGGRIAACLSEQDDEVSDACRAAVADVMGEPRR